MITTLDRAACDLTTPRRLCSQHFRWSGSGIFGPGIRPRQRRPATRRWRGDGNGACGAALAAGGGATEVGATSAPTVSLVRLSGASSPVRHRACDQWDGHVAVPPSVKSSFSDGVKSGFNVTGDSSTMGTVGGADDATARRARLGAADAPIRPCQPCRPDRPRPARSSDGHHSDSSIKKVTAHVSALQTATPARATRCSMNTRRKENAKHVLRAMKENARQGFWNGALPLVSYRIVAAEQRRSKTKKSWKSTRCTPTPCG